MGTAGCIAALTAKTGCIWPTSGFGNKDMDQFQTVLCLTISAALGIARILNIWSFARWQRTHAEFTIAKKYRNGMNADKQRSTPKLDVGISRFFSQTGTGVF
jgi:hypothetical protein